MRCANVDLVLHVVRFKLREELPRLRLEDWAFQLARAVYRSRAANE